ncbi:MAG: twin-arginine translocase subunit TatC [Saprospiraceae bacterium]|nr:twin-arginine translocase subunit TatC [Saprospiraceae bacterium]
MAEQSVQPHQGEVEAEMSFLEHLEVLRWHLIRGIASIALFGIVMFLSKDFVFDRIIFGPKFADFPTYQFFCHFFNTMCEPPLLEIQTIKVEEKFITHLKVSIILGLVVAFPYIFYEAWRFIKPGLYPREQRAAKGIVLICSMLFLTGVCFGYFIISPFALKFLSSYEIADTASTATLTSYVNNMTMYTVPAGIIFELPIVVFFLSKVGLITPEFMRKYRRMAIVVILVLAAIITPPDPTTQVLIGVPLYILYEVSILISKRVVAQQLEEEEAYA